MNESNILNEILRVNNLSVSTKTKRVIINRVNFVCRREDFFVILGKNGHGKTTLSLSIANLLNKNVFHIKGEVLLNGIDLLSLDESKLSAIRQKKIGYILQNPFSSFNPIKSIKSQFEEQSRLKNIPFDNFIALMVKLELKDYDTILKKYPFELSGGILQRLSAVRCLASNPDLIIADEPTSALDKPIANQLLNLFYNYVKEKEKALILITQDISIAENYADKIGFLNYGELSVISDKEKFFNSTENLDLKIILESYNQLKI